MNIVFSSKKAISAVISLILLMTVTVVSISVFNVWILDFQSKNMGKVEQESSKTGLLTYIDNIIEDTIYLRNDYNNLSVNYIKVDGRNCSFTPLTIGEGLFEIDIGNCLNIAKSATPEVVIITNKGVISKKVFLKNYVAPSYLNCLLDGVTVLHESSRIFYNSSLAEYDVEECHYITRNCDDGVLSGNSDFSYASCHIFGQDIEPDFFTFTNQSDVDTNTDIVSETLTPQGYQGNILVSITSSDSSANPVLSVDGGTTWLSSTQISYGNNLSVKLRSKPGYEETTIANITIGNYSFLWNITTKPMPGGELVLVPGNIDLGTSDFYVMKYEAKNDGTTGCGGDGCPISKPDSLPWTTINQTSARLKCESLGSGFHLITRAEWGTIARNAENNAINWVGGTIGSGTMFRGHTDSNPSTLLAVADDSNYYSGTNNVASSEQKRALILSNGGVVWDLSGNAFEWNNDTLTENSSLGTVGGWFEWSSITGFNQYKPHNSAYTGDNGMGRVLTVDSVLERGFLSGGYYGDASYAGLFALSLNCAPSYMDSIRGFRCAYTPQE